MVTDESLLYWTLKLRSLEDEVLRADGSPTSGGHGFRDPEAERYEGEVFCLADHERVKVPAVRISLAHSTRGGFYWRLAGVRAADLPPCPFLMTDNPDLKLVFQGPVFLHLDEPWAELEDRTYGPGFFCLKGNDWLGVLSFDANVSSTAGHLRVFSEADTVKISASQQVYFADSPDTVFGRLEVQVEGHGGVASLGQYRREDTGTALAPCPDFLSVSTSPPPVLKHTLTGIKRGE